MSYMNKAIKSR